LEEKPCLCEVLREPNTSDGDEMLRGTTIIVIG